MEADRKTELEINALAYLKILWQWKILLLSGFAIGVIIGAVWYKTAKRVFSSSVTFIQSRAEMDLSAMQGLGALSMLGMGSSSSEPPLIKHLEKYIKTREFIYPLKDSVFKNLRIYDVIVGADSTNVKAGNIFIEGVNSLLKVTREDGLITLKASYTDSLFAFRLATLVFERFNFQFNQERRRVLQENLVFVRSLSEKARDEMQGASSALRVFMERNRESGTPHLEEKRRELLLNLKMAEEKYIQAEKEKVLLEIKNEKKDEGLVIIEKPFVAESHERPVLAICIALSVIGTQLILAVAIAIVSRRRWITLV